MENSMSVNANWAKSSRSSDTFNCVEVRFRSASRCDNSGPNCLEVGMPEFVTSSRCDAGGCLEVGMPEFVTSTRCQNTSCVEVGRPEGDILVRDSKDKGGPVLAFAPQVWQEFMAAVKAGAFDR